MVWNPACLNREEGFWLFDAGEVLTGFARVRFRAKAGSLLRLRYGELLEGERKTWETRGENRPPAAMRAERSVVNNETETYLDEYVAQGGGAEFSVTVPEGMLARFSYGETEAILPGGCHTLSAGR